MERISRTRSICPICGRQLPAERVQIQDRVYLRRTCPEHGEYSGLIWQGPVDYRVWQGGSLDYTDETSCPTGCGICPDHQQGTCCVLYEVTSRCDLGCTFCFANGGEERISRWPRQKRISRPLPAKGDRCSSSPGVSRLAGMIYRS